MYVYVDVYVCMSACYTSNMSDFQLYTCITIYIYASIELHLHSIFSYVFLWVFFFCFVLSVLSHPVSFKYEIELSRLRLACCILHMFECGVCHVTTSLSRLLSGFIEIVIYDRSQIRGSNILPSTRNDV